MRTTLMWQSKWADMSCSSDSREIGCGLILVWVERIKKSFGGTQFDYISLHSELGHLTHKKTPFTSKDVKNNHTT